MIDSYVAKSYFDDEKLEVLFQIARGQRSQIIT